MGTPRTLPPESVFFRGRNGDLRLGEWVIPTLQLEAETSKKTVAVVLGFPDDQGVTINRGRAGAAHGPDSIRRHLYKMALPANVRWENRLAFFDYGNCSTDKNLNTTHSHAERLAHEVASRGNVGIALGGGHDFAAPLFRGFHASQPKKKWGLLNVDPHLDTREKEGDFTHSGNPFRTLIEGGQLKGNRLIQFGSRPSRNTRAAWEFCLSKQVQIQPFEQIRSKNAPTSAIFNQALTKLSRACDQIGVTIDIDSCCESEGASAAPVLGFTAWELCCFAAMAGAHKKVRYLEIAEVAPSLDPTERSSRVAAEVVYAFLNALVQRSR